LVRDTETILKEMTDPIIKEDGDDKKKFAPK
jgi:hypothetical protein